MELICLRTVEQDWFSLKSHSWNGNAIVKWTAAACAGGGGENQLLLTLLPYLDSTWSCMSAKHSSSRLWNGARDGGALCLCSWMPSCKSGICSAMLFFRSHMNLTCSGWLCSYSSVKNACKVRHTPHLVIVYFGIFRSLLRNYSCIAVAVKFANKASYFFVIGDTAHDGGVDDPLKFHGERMQWQQRFRGVVHHKFPEGFIRRLHRLDRRLNRWHLPMNNSSVWTFKSYQRTRDKRKITSSSPWTSLS